MTVANPQITIRPDPDTVRRLKELSVIMGPSQAPDHE